MTQIFKINVRVYYEDTDAGGVVYYANYLKFAERARTELLREIGINQTTLFSEQKILFVVRDVEMKLHKPARLDDLLTITTTIKERKNASIIFEQIISRADEKIASLNICVVCINENFKPTALPGFLVNKFEL